ncbi:MAG: S8 family serine peptidase [Bdellovibrionales bacterium]
MWKVSPLWGQQVIGADLAADFVSQRLQSGQASRVSTGNVDVISDRTPTSPVQTNAIKLDLLPAGDYPQHGDQTASLVSNPPFGVSPAVSWSALVNLETRQNDISKAKEAWNSNFISGLEAIDRTQTRLVTASIAYYGLSPRDAIDSFVDRGKMFIQAAGNDYPVPSFRGSAPHVGHIIVGSVGPNGIQTPYSREPTKIYAPSDDIQLSGPNDRFGGTSGAAPLVTGSIVNALAILPNLSNSEIEDLLARTSLPSFSQAIGYGPGLLNSYRMVVVAACLADKSSTQKETFTNLKDVTCFDQSIKAQEFRKDADRLLKNMSCVSQRDGLKALRASFLLQPSRDTALKLAEIYERLGFPGDARWYHAAAATLGTPEEQLRHFDKLLSEPSLVNYSYFGFGIERVKSRGFHALSLASRMPSNSPYVQITLDRIASLARSNNLSDQEQALDQAMIVGPRALPAIARLIVDSDDDQTPRSAWNIIGRLMSYEDVQHSWYHETIAFLRGSPFERYLPRSIR